MSHKSEQMLSTLHDITIEASSDAEAALVGLAAEAQELQSAIDTVQHLESMLSTAQRGHIAGQDASHNLAVLEGALRVVERQVAPVSRDGNAEAILHARW